MAYSDYLKDLKVMVSEVAKRQGIENYEINIDESLKDKNGFMGDFIFFEVVSKDCKKPLSLVMKYARRNEMLPNIKLLELNFARELYMYSTIFTSLKSFFSKNNTPILEYIPRLYWICKESEKQALIFENLVEKGFTMWNPDNQLDMDHTLLVVRNLGKWHGTVMAYRDQNEKDFQTWIPHLDEIRCKFYAGTGNMKFVLMEYKKMLNFMENNGQKKLIEKYRKFEDDYEKYYHCAEKISDRLVISHGDCWINNIMFKHHNDKEKSTESKFLDFQLSCLDSPVADLSFFIFTTADAAILDKLDIILKEYYRSLCSTIESLGSQPDKIFTFEDLQRHWKLYAINGLLLSIGVVKLAYMTKDEKPNFLEIVKAGEAEVGKFFEMKMKQEDLFMERVSLLLTYFGNKYL